MVRKAAFEWKIQFSNEKVLSDLYRTNHSVALCTGSVKVCQWELVRKGRDYRQATANYPLGRSLRLLWCLRGSSPRYLSLPREGASSSLSSSELGSVTGCSSSSSTSSSSSSSLRRGQEKRNAHRDKMEKRDKHYRQTGRWGQKNLQLAEMKRAHSVC